MKRKLVLSLMLALFLIGCGRTAVIKYDLKKENGLTDKKVEIKQLVNRMDGQIDIVFVKKGIPYQFAIDVQNKRAYEGKIEVSGFLKNGSVNIKLITLENKEIYNTVINEGAIKKNDRFDLYWGKYKLMINFSNAEEGNIKFKYKVLSI